MKKRRYLLQSKTNKAMFSKKITLLILLMTAILILNSCSKSSAPTFPDASASFGPPALSGNSNIHAPASAGFDGGSSINAYSWAWAFGDGGTSTQPLGIHKYTTSGTFTVSLTVGNSVGKLNTVSHSFTVLPAYTQVVLTSITIVSISGQSTSFPGYFRVTDASGVTNLYQTTNLVIDPAMLPTPFTLSAPYVFPNLGSVYIIQLWKAGSPATLLAASSFTPTSYNLGENSVNSYPSSVLGVAGSGLVFGIVWQ